MSHVFECVCVCVFFFEESLTRITQKYGEQQGLLSSTLLLLLLSLLPLLS